MATHHTNNKSLGGLILAVAIGLLIGSFLTQLFAFMPANVVKEFFTKSVSFGFGFNPDAVVIDLSAVKFKLGVTCQFSLLSLVGIAVSVYIFRWFT